MGFNKVFFENLEQHVTDYLKRFSATWVTVTIKIAHESEYNVRVLTKCTDELLTFAYYDAKKQATIPEDRAKQMGDTAYPAITIPYSSIAWVEINPGRAPGGAKETGFQYKPK